MGFLQRSANLVTYEWRRALAKKKLFVLVILVLALQVGLFVLLYYFLTNPPPGFTIIGPSLEEVKAMMWLVGVLGLQSLFIPLIAIVIAGGSMSEEYEHGTADILLSKPITKIEYMIGKFLGGLSLLGFVIALTTILGATLAYGLFGPQESIHFVPVIYLVLLYANLLFFSMAFMFSEVIRRTTLSIMAAFGILVASWFIGGILSTMYLISGGEQLYLEISKWLPLWSVSNLPSFVASELINAQEAFFVSVAGGGIQLAAAFVAAYTIALS
ncbi:MAG: ABC transporter permease subunit [Nitrososphaeria archaeon]|nr:ABC transporter permease subunit [Nitrososphaeria archaeon]NIQ32401.1 ABC transporter permease subunit [Nitrososphaeria archaeon]